MSRRFGIEYETCLITKTKGSWIESLSDFIFCIRKSYEQNINDSIFTDWCSKNFDNKIIVCDDDNKKWYFYVNKNDKIKEDNTIKIDEYENPYITYDSSVICHNNIRNRNMKEYNLDNGLYSINIEIVSQVFNNIDEFILFKRLLLIDTLFTNNKSQGIHITVDINNITDNILRPILLKKYIPWEHKYYNAILRTHSSIHAPKTPNIIIKEIQNKNISIFSILKEKLSSLRYKTINGINVLEFRVLSTQNTHIDLEKYITKILNLFIINSNKSKSSVKTTQKISLHNKKKNGSRKHKK